jgi:hypothetical protein
LRSNYGREDILYWIVALGKLIVVYDPLYGSHYLAKTFHVNGPTNSTSKHAWVVDPGVDVILYMLCPKLWA